MANGHGGRRTPSNPAPVSGPGALSRRTDGGPSDSQPIRLAPGGEYGSRKNMQEIQAGAPMLEAGGGPTPPPPVPLTAPTQRPGEPVTAGAAAGPGIGPEAAGILDDEQATLDQLRPLLYSLETIANLPSSTPQFRSFVRKLRVKAGGQPQ